MFKNLLCCVILCTLPSWAQTPVPSPCSSGEYWVRDEHTWIDWEVVSESLVGRLTPDWPADEDSPEALLEIDWQVSQWPEVVTFSAGQKLQASPNRGGGILIKDNDGGTWMRVRSEFGLCFVRASAKHVRPLLGQDSQGVASFPRPEEQD